MSRRHVSKDQVDAVQRHQVQMQDRHLLQALWSCREQITWGRGTRVGL